MNMKEKVTKLLGNLELGEKIIGEIRSSMFEEVSSDNRLFTDEEDWYMARLDDALMGVKKAIFAVQRMGFKVEDEI